MEIHELNTGAILSTDYVAIDSGSDTRKYDFGAFYNNLGYLRYVGLNNSVNIPSDSTASNELLSTTFPAIGKYIVIAKVIFPSNTNGSRACGYAVGDTTSMVVERSVSARATSSGSTMLQAVSFENVTTENYALRLLARQDSGSTLTIQYAYIMAIRLR